MHHKVYEIKVNVVHERKQCPIIVWDHLTQNIIDNSMMSGTNVNVFMFASKEDNLQH